MRVWPRWIGGLVALAAFVVDVAMGRLLADGRIFESVVLAIVWLVAAVLVLARVPQGASRHAPAHLAGMAIAVSVTRSLGFDPDRSSHLRFAAVMTATSVVVMVPMALCLARIVARREA